MSKYQDKAIVFHCRTVAQLNAVFTLMDSFGFRPFTVKPLAPCYIRLGLNENVRGTLTKGYSATTWPGVVGTLEGFAKLPKIGEYQPEVKEDGIQVGCTFVPWATVDALVAARKKL